MIIFSMDQQQNEDQDRIWLMNNDGAVRLSKESELYKSRYIQARVNFNDGSDKSIINLPPTLDDMHVEELSAAINGYQYIIKGDFDAMQDKSQRESSKIALTAMKLAYHLFDEDNFCKTAQFFFKQIKTDWAPFFYPTKDNSEIQRTIAVLKEKLFTRITSLIKNDKIIRTRLSHESVSCSLDGTRFAINNTSPICSIYDQAGEIVETIDLSNFYNKDRLIIYSDKTFFFKKKGSVDIFVHFLDRTKSSTWFSQIFEYENGDINMQNTITLPTENAWICIDFSNDTYVYRKDDSSIETIKQENGELIFCKCREDLFMPIKLNFCGSDVIIVDFMLRLEIFNPVTKDRYPLGK